MKCDPKMMLKAAAWLGVALVVTYLALPAARTYIVFSAPLLLLLICPVGMLLMKTMKGRGEGDGAEPDETSPRPRDQP